MKSGQEGRLNKSTWIIHAYVFSSHSYISGSHFSTVSKEGSLFFNTELMMFPLEGSTIFNLYGLLNLHLNHKALDFVSFFPRCASATGGLQSAFQYAAKFWEWKNNLDEVREQKHDFENKILIHSPYEFIHQTTGYMLRLYLLRSHPECMWYQK